MNHPAFPFSRLLALCSLLAFMPVIAPHALQAQSIVEICSQEELEAKIAEARSAEDFGDGLVLINCDGILSLTNTITLNFDSGTNDPINEITLDATGYGVTISGLSGTNATNAVRLFLVDSGVTLTLINIKLIDGKDTNGGAVYVRTNGALYATSCIFSNNFALGTNGLDGASAPDNESEGRYGKSGSTGTAGMNGWGGAVYALGTAGFDQCTFLTNSAIGGNGGLGGSGSAGRTIGGDGANGGRGGSALGGAIYSAGTLGITNSSFNFNSAVGGIGGEGGTGGDGVFPGVTGHGASGGAASGAAVFSDKSSSAIMVNTTFALNGAFGGDSATGGTKGARGKSGSSGAIGSGGGLANYGTNLLINCTFFGNLVVGGIGGDGATGRSIGGKGGSGGAAWGGNLYNGGRKSRKGIVQAINCTFSDGGAIGGTNGLGGDGAFPGKNGSRGASRGGNIANSNGTFLIQNTLVAYPNPGTNAYGKFTDNGHNILSDRSYKFSKSSTSTNFIANPTDNQLKLGVLARNGGLVETLELFEDSPAIDAGDDEIILHEVFEEESPDLTVDARGVDRTSPIDIGAYEAGLILGPPRFLQHPISRTVREGASVTFTAIVQGDSPMIFQWQKGTGSDAEDLGAETTRIDTNGQTIVTYTIDFALDSDAGDYSVIAFNNSGSTTSEAGTLAFVHPPLITDFPANFIQSLGVDFTLTVEVEGDAPFTYEWYRNGQRILGATLSTLIVGNPQSTAEYYVIVRNDFGEAISSPVRVTVLQTSASIVTHPVDDVAPVGGVAEFTVDAGGSQPLFYQWYFNETNLLVGKTSHTLTIGSLQASNAGTYRVVVSNAVNSVTSSNATLIVQTTKPTISSQPANAGVTAGSTASFTVGVGGSSPFGYRWYYNSTTNFSTTTPISNGTNATLNVTNAQTSSVGYYTVLVTNFLGSVTSTPAQLSIQSSPPVIQTNPVSATVFTGATNTFSVVAIGSGPLLYQWYFNSNVVLGATNSAFTINNAQSVNAGFYHVTVTNGLGSVTSAPVTLTVSNSAPVVTVQPLEPLGLLEINRGDTVTLSVTAVGSLPFSYQWYHYGMTNDGFYTYVNSTNLVLNATNATLTLSPVESEDVPAVEGGFVVWITNLFGGTFSEIAYIFVNGEGVP